MEEFFFIVIIIVVVIINIMKKMADYNRDRPNSEDSGWDEWESEGEQQTPAARQGPTQSPAQRTAQGGRQGQVPTPSERVRTILKQLQDLESGQAQSPQRSVPPTPPPMSRKQPRPEETPRARPPTPKPLARTPSPAPEHDSPYSGFQRELPVFETSAMRQTAQDEKALETEMARAAAANAAADTDRVATESMARAFPAAMKMVRTINVGNRRPIVIRAMGRSNMRRAVVLGEILGQPRAYDV